MAASVDMVEVAAALLVSPSGVLILTASAPNLDPFERLYPKKHDLWIRLEATGQHAQRHPRIEFVTRPRKPYTMGTTPRPLAHGPMLSSYGVRAFRLLAMQRVADLIVAKEPPAGDTPSPPLHLIAFIEPPSYDWNRYQTLCAQFEAERRSSRRTRIDVGGDAPRRQRRRGSAKHSQTRASKVAPARK